MNVLEAFGIFENNSKADGLYPRKFLKDTIEGIFFIF